MKGIAARVAWRRSVHFQASLGFPGPSHSKADWKMKLICWDWKKRAREHASLILDLQASWSSFLLIRIESQWGLLRLWI